jgi:membrane protease YdiL (CAAX protease family)
MTPDPPSSTEPEPLPTPEPEPERYPFWGYSDLLLFVGLAVPAMLIGLGVVKGVYTRFHLHPSLRVAELLPQQLVGYGLLFGVLAMILRVEYGRPFWRSLAWTGFRMPLLWVVNCGLFTALAVLLIGALFQTPNTSNPMTQLMEDRTSRVVMAIFGVTVAPLAEELLFRGFLQPLLVRSLGVIAGILMTSIPFGFLHFYEYGNSWRHAVLISLAGAAFGWMRHITGSTRASAIMHTAYNGFVFFLVFFQQGRTLPHT